MVVAAAHEECPYCGTAIAKAKVAEVTARIRGEEQRRIAAAETQAKEKYETQLKEANEKIATANVERAAFDLKLKQSIEAATATAKKAADEEHAKKLNDEIARARELLKLDFDKQMLKQAADATKDKDELAKKVAELQRKLDAKGTRDDGADIDVYEQMRAAFGDKGDRVVRMAEDAGGGATIIYEVVHKGTSCARILIDAKIRRNYQAQYATKLHDEMVSSKADYALLATVALPKDQQELCEQSGVLLVHPSRVVALVTILRRSLVKMFQANLSTKEREQKVAKLYKFVTSEACRHKLAEPSRIADALLKLDVAELQAHEAMWKKRGELERKIQSVMADVIDDIDAILEGNDD
jgi:hypothetical protein